LLIGFFCFYKYASLKLKIIVTTLQIGTLQPAFTNSLTFSE
jgi:hypothetical protein